MEPWMEWMEWTVVLRSREAASKDSIKPVGDPTPADLDGVGGEADTVWVIGAGGTTAWGVFGLELSLDEPTETISVSLTSWFSSCFVSKAKAAVAGERISISSRLGIDTTGIGGSGGAPRFAEKMILVSCPPLSAEAPKLEALKAETVTVGVLGSSFPSAGGWDCESEEDVAGSGTVVDGSDDEPANSNARALETVNWRKMRTLPEQSVSKELNCKWRYSVTQSRTEGPKAPHPVSYHKPTELLSNLYRVLAVASPGTRQISLLVLHSSLLLQALARVHLSI
ncbi:hypothetical protein BDP27DRAFT_1375090 [Rhodocollybia butyracea]|uniref:Uncharacterized protein n=1 Tax=Rhodocollybia butyracea TaxID=206335 RepID=A0A9P5TW87_9AGAR|nr:hypothetical protein BDP27DRAFT_1375090 [Rhodocollybia butyracea]